MKTRPQYHSQKTFVTFESDVQLHYAMTISMFFLLRVDKAGYIYPDFYDIGRFTNEF